MPEYVTCKHVLVTMKNGEITVAKVKGAILPHWFRMGFMWNVTQNIHYLIYGEMLDQQQIDLSQLENKVAEFCGMGKRIE